MFCRHHRDETGCRQHPEHCEHHTNLLEQIMGDTTKLATDVTALVALIGTKDSRIADLEAANAQLIADAATKDDTDQVAIDAIDAQVVAALPAPEAGTTRTQYVYVGGDASTIDTTQYTASAVAPDGRQLYTFAGDLNPGDSTGTNADFQVYIPV